jgi:hypothetical protein
MRKVRPLASVHAVRTSPAHDDIVSTHAEDPVTTTEAADDIAIGRPDQAFAIRRPSDVAVPCEGHAGLGTKS